MTWARYDDRFTSARAWDEVSYPGRWHYIAIVEQCCATGRYDGILPIRTALRASDVPEPELCHKELERVGLVQIDEGLQTLRIVHIDEHVPRPSERDETLLPRKRRNTREYRLRKCERGEHSKDCPRDTCPLKRGGSDASPPA